MRKNNKKGIILAINWSSAYNRTLRKEIIERLIRDKVFDENEIKILVFILTNLEIKVGKVSTKTEISVQQGLSTSPLLYVQEMDILINKLIEAGFKNVQALADDLQVYIEGNLNDQKKAIKIIKEYESERKQKLNPKKCGIIELGTHKKNRIIPESVQDIPNCTEIGYKYQGVHLTRIMNYNTYMNEKRLKIWAIVSKIKRYSNEWNLNKKRLIIKAQIQPHLDYIGMLLLLGKKRDMEKFKASMRRYTRVIQGLGFNVKNELVDLFVDVNREKNWINRLEKIKNDWKELAGYEWEKINKICEEKKFNNCREVNLKNMDKENQEIMIEIINKFNRAWCCEHKNRRLSTSHLQEHGVILNYDIIENAIKSNNIEKLKEIAKTLRQLEINNNPNEKNDHEKYNEKNTEKN